MKDRELIEQMEALSDIVDWLEQKNSTDMENASESVSVDEDEIDEWLKSPPLKKMINGSD
jgi:hypothetical protein